MNLSNSDDLMIADSPGKIIIEHNANVWEHEIETARSLTAIGLTVKFVRCSKEKFTTSADVVINGEEWEMKAPTASNSKAIERNLRKAAHQSCNVVFDSRRMKKMPDAVIERELRKYAAFVKGIKRLLFIDRNGCVIEIK